MTESIPRAFVRRALVLSLLFVAGAVVAAPVSAQGAGMVPGADFPSFTVTDLHGNELDIDDVVEAGKPAVIEIWATWCTICAAIAPQLDTIYERHGDDVSVVAIAVATNQTRDEVAAYVEERGLDWRFVWDRDGDAVRALGVFGTGVVITVDRDGRVVAASPGVGRDLVAEVEALLGGR